MIAAPCGQTAAGSDVWSTSVGVQYLHASAVGADDLDLLFGQRLVWTVQERPGLATRALANGRFTVDPAGDIVLERTRVSTLAAEVSGGPLTATFGRSPVYLGGPRLVDGAQVIGRFKNGIELGAWGGLAPDLFTTLPRVRPGGGPILAYVGSATQVSTVGEAVFFEGGLDRAGVLTQIRYAPGPGLQTSGRADVQLADADGRAGLADGAVSVRVAPTRAFTSDLLYDAYSSLRYRTTSELDPRIQRFAARIEALGLSEGITQDLPDPTLFHLVSLRNRLRATEGTLQPAVGLETRYRHAADPAARYGRIRPSAGFESAERFGLTLDGGVLWVDSATQGDLGAAAWLDVLPSADLTLDGSFRLLIAPRDYGDRPGWYTDLFVESVLANQVVLIGGASLEHEPLIDFDDVALGVFMQLSTSVRHARPADRDGGASGSPPRAETL